MSNIEITGDNIGDIVAITKFNAQCALENAARVQSEKEWYRASTYGVLSMAKDFLRWLNDNE